MDSDQFVTEVDKFFTEIRTLLESTLEGETRVVFYSTNEEKKRAAFTIDKTLKIGKPQSDRLHLKCVYRLCTNSTGNHLAIELSTFKVEFKSVKKFVPVVRFEYDRNARNKPASHFQFHADSVELGLLLARAGRYKTAAQQQDVHFPMGGDRFRVCLEDVIELLVREFCAVPKENWESLVQKGRQKYELQQAETVIRQNLALAIKLLEKSGYVVTPPNS
ncbi:hypothetical protein ACFSSC_00835 [Corynebacterium mendelii]|uniref:Uncharacterized protein n=1 Tax=Corynebacterium mendelii TaxID=2765362 RepID=A0A939DZR6_9CORY|nr:hypothetical protein [Corynebacterium mendelii]MBN9643830.1 hypothetical protein [Corynebacterium mendelii]